MSEERIQCPSCSSTKCLYGDLRPNDQDYSFDGRFYPLHIEKKSFWRLSSPSVRIPKGEKFWACSDCGHLWSKIDLGKFQSVLKSNEWDGSIQKEPPAAKPYVMWFFSLIIFLLLAIIAFFKIVA